MKERSRREVVEKIMRVVKVKVEIKKMRKIGEKKRRWRGRHQRIRNKNRRCQKEKKPVRQKGNDIGRHDMKKEKDKMETAKNSKSKKEGREQSMVETGENKNRREMELE